MGYLNTEAATKIAEDAAPTRSTLLSGVGENLQDAFVAVDTSNFRRIAIDNPLSLLHFFFETRPHSRRSSNLRLARSTTLCLRHPNIDAGRAKVSDADAEHPAQTRFCGIR